MLIVHIKLNEVVSSGAIEVHEYVTPEKKIHKVSNHRKPFPSSG